MGRGKKVGQEVAPTGPDRSICRQPRKISSARRGATAVLSSRRMRWIALVALALGCRAGGPPPDAGPAAAAPEASAPSPAPDASAPDGAAAPCPGAGMGAVVYDGGVLFRVWAPNAERAFVAGDFNGWRQDANELAREEGGLFAACVAGARAGQSYELVLHHQGQVLVRRDPRALQVTSSTGFSVIVAPAAHAPFVASGAPIIYELHVGTFNDAPGGKPGTFRSAQEKLDHLAALGVTMIELLPVAEFAGDFSMGYNPALPFAVESAYGTPEDLRALVAAAHARGIGVIMDAVYNHWGPQDLALWCFDGECFGAGGIYFFTDWRQQTPWGPRPDYGRPAVREYIRDNALLWLDEYGMDGLRWDSTGTMRRDSGGEIPEGWSLMRELNDLLHRRFPRGLQIAEDLQGDAALTRPTTAGGAGFDAQWDASFAEQLRSTLLNPDDRFRSVRTIRELLAGNLSRVIFTESHDTAAVARLPSLIDRDEPTSVWARRRSALGAAIVLTAPGIPMLLQGQELLEDGAFKDTRPLDWSKAETNAGNLALYRDLIALRKNLAGKTRGLLGTSLDVFHVNELDKVIAYRRDDVVVLANFANRSYPAYRIGLPRAGMWKVRLSTEARAYGADYAGAPEAVAATPGARDGLESQADVPLGPYTAVILSQD
jgi:1,4-alpha-glucan branching enzyme